MVQLGFRNDTRQLELVDKSHLLPRVQALSLLETRLGAMRGHDGDQDFQEFTQNIPLQAPGLSAASPRDECRQ
jgi:putative hemolysin